jgi:membrane fusion protein (multidrug efflux system)
MDTGGGKRAIRGRTILVLVIVVVAAVFALRFWMLSGKKSYASIAAIQEAEGIPVEVAAAAVGNIELWTTLAGTVEGSFQYPIVSLNSISVLGVTKKEGDRVRPGELLVRLEKSAPNPLLLSYPRSLAVYQDALADLERMRNLYEEGAISRQALDKAELSAEVAKSNLSDARQSADLFATHAGVVTSVLIKDGETANAYQPLMWIARTDSVRIAFEAGSRQAKPLRVGQKAVWSSQMNGASGSGVVTRMDLSADPESHLLRGEAMFPNPGKELVPGTVVSFRVLSSDRRNVVKIPVGCLVERGGATHVFVVEAGEAGKSFARLRKVVPGLQTVDEVEIVSGLAGGERVVEFGQTLLEDGALVKIVREGEAH